MVPFSDEVPDINGARRLTPVRGGVEKTDVEEGKIKYRVSKGRLIPFIDLSFHISASSAVKEIWMGPRCATPKEEFATFLCTTGYSNVLVKQAGSKYR